MSIITQEAPPRRRARARVAQPGALSVVDVACGVDAILTTVSAESASGNGCYTIVVRQPFADDGALAADHYYDRDSGGPMCIADAHGHDCRHVRAALHLVLHYRALRLRDSLQSRADLHPESATYYAPLVADYDRTATGHAVEIEALGFRIVDVNAGTAQSVKEPW